MMRPVTLRPAELLDACQEVARALAGRPLQKVVQPDPHTILLGFPKRWLLVSVAPRHGRLHLLDERPPATGEAAPAFCMLLRKRLVGARLAAVEAVAGERACALEFRHADEGLRLVALLFDGAARLALTDAEGRSLGAIGPGKLPAPSEIVALPPPRADDRPSRFGADPSKAIAAHYAGAAAEAAAAVEEAARRRAAARLARREQALLGDLDRVRTAADRRIHADLLLAHLAEVPRGAAEVTLPDDFHDGAPITIPLDPARSPKENAARLYKEHQRRSRGRASIESRLAATRAEIARLERGEMAPPAPRQKREKPGTSARRVPFRRFRSASGAQILVGRGADKNDQLTFHVARGNDLWLHTRDYPGAHVVVPRAGEAPLDQETLLDAATLAVHHSPARGESAADVTYAPRKLVRKPKGAAPGLVSVAGGKTVRVRMEPERVARLLATREDD
jgi:predicted ribosome quality control (RQC) complex YloA/Tae2 family protein